MADNETCGAFLGTVWAPAEKSAAFANADLCTATVAALVTLLLWYDFSHAAVEQSRAQGFACSRASLFSGHVRDAKVYLESQMLGSKVNKHKKCCQFFSPKI